MPETDVETAPKRIQRKRTRGWKAPAGAIYVGRPSKWGNQFTTAELYRWWGTECLAGKRRMNEARKELRGKDLMCWCWLDQPCHADVLLELANR